MVYLLMTRRQTHQSRMTSDRCVQQVLQRQPAQAGLRDERRNGRNTTEEISESSCSTFAGPARYRATGNTLRRAQCDNNIEQES